MEQMNETSDSRVRVEIPLAVFAKMIRSHRISIEDMRCLDPASKSQIRDLYLQACMTTEMTSG